MTPNEREIFVSHAKHADQMAGQFAVGSFENESWRNIAEGYRTLIQGIDRRMETAQPQP